MNKHQQRLWQSMIGSIDSYLDGKTDDFYGTVGKLEGALDSSEINDDELIKQWYDFWAPLEIRRAVEGNNVTKAQCLEELEIMKKFLLEKQEGRIMYRNGSVINLIKENSFSLRKFNYSGTAFTKENAIEVIRQILPEPILILGGDVYELSGDSLIPLSDNWSCEAQATESFEEFCQRSKAVSVDYISKYPAGQKTLFAIVFSQEVNDALEISENDVTETALILDQDWLMCPGCIDAWESGSQKSTVICPKCSHSFHNPRYGA